MNDQNNCALVSVTDLKSSKLNVCGLSVLYRNILSLKKAGFQVVLTGPELFKNAMKKAAQDNGVSYLADKDTTLFKSALKISGDVQFSLSFFSQVYQAINRQPHKSLFFKNDQNKFFPAKWVCFDSSASQSIVLHGAHFEQVSEVLQNQTYEDAPGVLSQKLFQEIYRNTEGWVARGINKKISFPITKKLVQTSITPNQITLFCLFLGLIGAALFLAQSWWVRIVGASLIQLSSILDGCDGEVARLKVVSSKFGAWFDTVADDIVNNVMFVCLSVGYFMEFANLPLLKFCILTSFACLGVSFFLYHYMITHNNPNAASFRLSWEKQKTSSHQTKSQKTIFDWIKPVLKRDFFVFFVWLLIIFDQREVLFGLFAPIWGAFFLYLASFIHSMTRQENVSHARA